MNAGHDNSTRLKETIGTSHLTYYSRDSAMGIMKAKVAFSSIFGIEHDEEPTFSNYHLIILKVQVTLHGTFGPIRDGLLPLLFGEFSSTCLPILYHPLPI